MARFQSSFPTVSYAAGAQAVFGPDARIEDSACKVLEEIRKIA